MDTKGIGDDIAFLGQPLTPSLLVRTANPRHDRAGARNAIVIRGGSRPRDSRICYARTMPGVRLMQHPKGEYARARLWGVSRSRHQCRSLARPRKPNRGTEMNNSPYLDRPSSRSPSRCRGCWKRSRPNSWPRDPPRRGVSAREPN